MPRAALTVIDHSETPRVTTSCPAAATGGAKPSASTSANARYNSEVTSFQALTSDGDLNAVLAASHVAPVILFKHSETCGVSLMVRDGLEEGVVPAAVHEVVVQRHRMLSARIASLLGVRHESPQALVVTRGAVTWHSSHNGVSAGRIAAAWRQAIDALTTPAAATR